jgi:hypothetical protein
MTMAKPKADAARCDVFGCGHIATIGTDGSEKDIQNLNRKAIPNLNVCVSHENWPFSNDAERFAAGDVYKNRK